MNELSRGYFATRIYLPLSRLSRRWRGFFRHVRGKSDRFTQATRLPEVSWKDCTPCRDVKVWEHAKENGNVRISELGILSAIAAGCADGSNLFEIGTFDGRTSLNLALSSPARCAVYTLDLPPDLATKFALAEGERHMVDKPSPGSRYERNRALYPAAVGKIHQLIGDSATFDYAPYKNSCSLVFVDGSHHHDYVVSDTRAAMDMARAGGVVLWHDYGVWDGVTTALEELQQEGAHGLRHVGGTSLVYWQKASAE